MLGVLQQLPPKNNFLARFFRNTIQSDTDTIDIDIVKGGRRVIPYVRPVQEGVVMERNGFKTNSYKIPYARVKMASECDKFLNRSLGDTPYTPETPAQRAAAQLVNDLRYLNDCLDDEEERQRAEALTTGAVTIRNAKGTAIQNVGFDIDPSHFVTASPAWDDEDAKKNEILAQCRAWRNIIADSGAPAPNYMIVASDVEDVIIDKFDPNDTTSGLSSIRVDRGQVDITNLPGGVTYLGYFKELGCDIYGYRGKYTDLDGTQKPYIPTGKVIFLSDQARFDRNYGAIKNFNAGFAAVPRFPLTWIENDGRARFLQLESAPLMTIHQVDAIVIATVLS
jgi:hypothetical protein